MSAYTIGVTGHRKLPKDRIPGITQSVREFFTEVKKEHEEVAVLSPLAEGADSLCAKLALNSGLRLIAPLPMSLEEYRVDFSKKAAKELDALIAGAHEVFSVSTQEPVPENPTRGFFYRQSGLYVVNHCDILLAIWDGLETDTSDGAGTWETVKAAQETGKLIRHLTV